MATFLFSLLALGVIFIIVDLFENLDKFLDRNTGILHIAEYYLYYIPAILKLLIPIGTLLATLFTIGNLSNTNEITAMKSGSLSLYQLMIPVIILSILISITQLWFSTMVVPRATKVKNEMAAMYLGMDESSKYLNNIFIRENKTRNILIKEFNSKTMQGSGIQIQDFSSESNPRLLSKIYASMFRWDSQKKNWILMNIKKQIYEKVRIKEQLLIDQEFKFSFNNSELSDLVKPIEEMNIFELYKFLVFQKNGGKDINQSLTDFYGIIAFPIANFIVILFGVPFASVKRRGGIAIQIGAALIVSFAYLIFTKIGQIVGISVGIGPIISAWLANILFFLVGLFVIFKTPK
ncbi:MAG: hypothetical protein A2X64_10635 [Ignavibacteria bacterium GWF2_33_9]|nr:MAG: hypothetical protein A2X64_10635 [Ignavibacteria bacterium GWF2_33_9]